ncbi:MAG: hypothetical protein K2G44_00075 [Clostridia bacterium]|nr:hypothetical protein [Clostridia bacterium]
MGFYGTFNHQMDAKNRIRIPAKFKSAVPKGEPLYFFRHRENCFAVMPESSLNKMMSTFEEANPLGAGTDDEQDAMTHIYSLIAGLEEDNQGRVTIPKMYRDAAQITKEEPDVVTIGRGSYIEIFSQKVYEQRIANQSLSQAKLIAQKKKPQENE